MSIAHATSRRMMAVNVDNALRIEWAGKKVDVLELAPEGSETLVHEISVETIHTNQV